MAECCNNGICEVKSQLVGSEQAISVLQGLANRAVRQVRSNPGIGVRDLTESISDGNVTLQDVMDTELAPEPIAYYMPDRDGDIVPGTDLPFSRLTLAVATCVTRAVDGVCVELVPIELGK